MAPVADGSFARTRRQRVVERIALGARDEVFQPMRVNLHPETIPGIPGGTTAAPIARNLGRIPMKARPDRVNSRLPERNSLFFKLHKQGETETLACWASKWLRQNFRIGNDRTEIAGFFGRE